MLLKLNQLINVNKKMGKITNNIREIQRIIRKRGFSNKYIDNMFVNKKYYKIVRKENMPITFKKRKIIF